MKVTVRLRLSLVAVGVVLGLAPAAVLPAAGAATCTSGGGVSVVVDFRELGGTTITACAADGGGKSATQVFASVGVDISYATRQPGFVCRVQGVPTSDPCVNASPANAYWGLWWADGSKASWTYSSSGIGGLTVPVGGSVGWSWQQDRENSGAVPPGVLPPVAATATPSPTASPTASASTSPTAQPSRGGGSTGGAGGGGSQSSSPSPTSGSTASSTPPQATPSGTPAAPSESPAASESPGDSRSSADADPSASASESPGDPSASSDTEAGSPSADEPARVPAALTWGIVGLLAIAIAVSAVVARRRRGV